MSATIRAAEALPTSGGASKSCRARDLAAAGKSQRRSQGLRAAAVLWPLALCTGVRPDAVSPHVTATSQPPAGNRHGCQAHCGPGPCYRDSGEAIACCRNGHEICRPPKCLALQTCSRRIVEGLERGDGLISAPCHLDLVA